jgi:hypothetical protein
MRFPSSGNFVVDEVQKVDVTISCTSANVLSTAFHHGIRRIGFQLKAGQSKPLCTKSTTYRGCDNSFVDIDFVHRLLTSSYQDFMDTLRGECHAAQIFHVILTKVTLALARLESVG